MHGVAAVDQTVDHVSPVAGTRMRQWPCFVRSMLSVGAYWRSHLRVGAPQSITKILHINVLIIIDGNSPPFCPPFS